MWQLYFWEGLPDHTEIYLSYKHIGTISTYTAKSISDKQIRNDFVLQNFAFYSFLSSWERGEFNILQGHSITRMGIYDEWDRLIWVTLLLKVAAKRWTFWLAPHSPLIKEDYFKVLWAILPELRTLAKKEWIAFLRINGVTEHSLPVLNKYQTLWFRSAPIHMHAEETNLLSLQWTEEEMLKNVKKGTRYIINRARREGVVVEHNNSEESIASFIDMHVSHAKRTNGKSQYTPFSKTYIHDLFKTFGDRVNVFNAYYEWVKEAACVTVQFGETTVYYLGASDIKHPKFSPAYLCQRTAIQYAREHWSKTYNFRGVSPDDNKAHPLYGVSFFKRSFGWDDYFLSHAQDYIFNFKYRITRAIDRYRAWNRNYYYPLPKE